MRPTPPSTRRAFTLIEATLAIAITGILLLGMGGALLMSIRAADTGSDSLAAAGTAAGALDLLNAELATATTIAAATPTDLLFTVPDRTGDGQPERIEYTWSGVSGAPVYRSYNGSAPGIAIASVKTLNLSLLARPAAVPVESAERVLASFDGGSVGGTSNQYAVDDSNSAAQYVRVSLPANATAWRITKVKLYIKKAAGASKLVAVTVQSATAAMKPSATVLGVAAFAASSAPTSGGWMEFVLAPTGTGLTLAPGQGVCIVVRDGTGGDCKVYSVSGSSSQPFNTHFMSAPASGVWTTRMMRKTSASPSAAR